MHGRLHPAAAQICVSPSLTDPTGCSRSRCYSHNSRCRVSSHTPIFLSLLRSEALPLSRTFPFAFRILSRLYKQVVLFMMPEMKQDPYLLINPTEGSVFSNLCSYLLVIVCFPPLLQREMVEPTGRSSYSVLHANPLCKVNKVLRRAVKVKKKQRRKWERVRLCRPSGYHGLALFTDERKRHRSTNVQPSQNC